ncbi:hypothetical protein [Kitasatospora sp. A2-31]|uniref:hypothetical protein n=1 Tax=Kitasatospora sp. A2-31 TaxID=2916414 RepID=UPI001EEB956A|nr:hypothetical protein [Kitasatospora sp. A2-31]MCG6497618.1 hypothetical protein [Kitasatospora sp. A2-31]
MFQLLMPGKSSQSLARAAARAIRSVIAPATLFTPAAPAPAVEPVTAPDPAGLYEPDEMPAVEDIEAAARTYHAAADQARRADRGKRAAKKILDRLPAGTYAGWKVERVASGRQTADLDEIRRIFKQHGLGPVPMRASAPSLKVSQVEAPAVLVAVAA